MVRSLSLRKQINRHFANVSWTWLWNVMAKSWLQLITFLRCSIPLFFFSLFFHSGRDIQQFSGSIKTKYWDYMIWLRLWCGFDQENQLLFYREMPWKMKSSHLSFTPECLGTKDLNGKFQNAKKVNRKSMEMHEPNKWNLQWRRWSKLVSWETFSSSNRSTREFHKHFSDLTMKWSGEFLVARCGEDVTIKGARMGTSSPIKP